MKIAIICAMGEELDAIINGLHLKTSNANNVTTATYNNHELFLNLCGIGKVNAAMNTQKLISSNQFDYIINVGVAGNLSDTLNFGDVVVATDLVHHDMDVTGFDIPLGQVPRMDVFAFASDANLLKIAKNIVATDFQIAQGRIASGDQFVTDKNKAQFIHKEFNALACEMEGAAVAHVCHVNEVAFLVIRSMSDKAGNEEGHATHSYEEFKDMAAKRASFVVKEILNRV